MCEKIYKFDIFPFFISLSRNEKLCLVLIICYHTFSMPSRPSASRLPPSLITFEQFLYLSPIRKLCLYLQIFLIEWLDRIIYLLIQFDNSPIKAISLFICWQIVKSNVGCMSCRVWTIIDYTRESVNWVRLSQMPSFSLLINSFFVRFTSKKIFIKVVDAD